MAERIAASAAVAPVALETSVAVGREIAASACPLARHTVAAALAQWATPVVDIVLVAAAGTGQA